jgi:hypothetical protein
LSIINSNQQEFLRLLNEPSVPGGGDQGAAELARQLAASAEHAAGNAVLCFKFGSVRKDCPTNYMGPKLGPQDKKTLKWHFVVVLLNPTV